MEVRELVRINDASAEEIARLQDVGPVLAKRIVEARKRGPFHTPEDLARVRGISRDLAATLAPFIDWSVLAPASGRQDTAGEKAPVPLAPGAELVLKISTALLGVVYVLGLLISNLQMMELGIADFSALHARNVSVGTLFLVYMVLLLLAVWVCVLFVWSVVDAFRGRCSWWEPFLGLVLTGILFMIAASFVGYLSPSGLPWWPGWEDLDWGEGFDRELATFAALGNQFSDAFFHPKVVLAGLLLAGWAFALSSNAGRNEHGFGRWRALMRQLSAWSRRTIGFAVVGFLMAVGLVMVDYADEVYPNLRYNLGGGQPRVATLQTGTESGRRSVLAGFPAEEQTGVTGPVVIWHQSDKFLYVSSLFELPVGRAQMAGLGLADIRGIQYLPAYVKVSSGYRIDSVHPSRDPARNQQ